MVEHELGEADFIPFKTGVPDMKMIQKGPNHILDAEEIEPLFIHQEYILENCLSREA